jgi:hypothetical protein
MTWPVRYHRAILSGYRAGLQHHFISAGRVSIQTVSRIIEVAQQSGEMEPLTTEYMQMVRPGGVGCLGKKRAIHE